MTDKANPRNRYDNETVDDRNADDESMDAWFDDLMSMTPEQQKNAEALQEAEFKNLMHEMNERWRRMTPKQVYAYRRLTNLRLAINSRLMINDGMIPDFFRKRLKETQVRMLKIRHEYYYGQQAGTA